MALFNTNTKNKSLGIIKFLFAIWIFGIVGCKGDKSNYQGTAYDFAQPKIKATWTNNTHTKFQVTLEKDTKKQVNVNNQICVAIENESPKSNQAKITSKATSHSICSNTPFKKPIWTCLNIKEGAHLKAGTGGVSLDFDVAKNGVKFDIVIELVDENRKRISGQKIVLKCDDTGGGSGSTPSAAVQKNLAKEEAEKKEKERLAALQQKEKLAPVKLKEADSSKSFKTTVDGSQKTSNGRSRKNTIGSMNAVQHGEIKEAAVQAAKKVKQATEKVKQAIEQAAKKVENKINTEEDIQLVKSAKKAIDEAKEIIEKNLELDLLEESRMPVTSLCIKSAENTIREFYIQAIKKDYKVKNRSRSILYNRVVAVSENQKSATLEELEEVYQEVLADKKTRT